MCPRKWSKARKEPQTCFRRETKQLSMLNSYYDRIWTITSDGSEPSQGTVATIESTPIPTQVQVLSRG